MKRLMTPLSEEDYCAIELIIKEETKFLKEELDQENNADYRKLCSASIARNNGLLKRLWILSEWNR